MKTDLGSIPVHVRSKMTVKWPDALNAVDRFAERLGPQDTARQALQTSVMQLRACPSSRLDAYADAAADVSDLASRAQRLLELDPCRRDPFWSLRDCISDLSRCLSDVLERVIDPLFSSEQALESYLATLGSSSKAVGLREIIAGYDQPARRRLVAALAYRLARSRNPEGIATWFRTPRPQLGNRTPAAVLEGDGDEATRLLIPLAGGTVSDVRAVVR
jgi:hypothetical protein